MVIRVNEFQIGDWVKLVETDREGIIIGRCYGDVRYEVRQPRLCAGSPFRGFAANRAVIRSLGSIVLTLNRRARWHDTKRSAAIFEPDVAAYAARPFGHLGPFGTHRHPLFRWSVSIKAMHSARIVLTLASAVADLGLKGYPCQRFVDYQRMILGKQLLGRARQLTPPAPGWSFHQYTLGNESLDDG